MLLDAPSDILFVCVLEIKILHRKKKFESPTDVYQRVQTSGSVNARFVNIDLSNIGTMQERSWSDNRGSLLNSAIVRGQNHL